MKKIVSLFVILLSLEALAESNVKDIIPLEIVLSDSIVCNYMYKICEIDPTDFVLFEDEGTYSWQDGDMIFEEHRCKEMPPCNGFIKKNKIRRDKAVVKVYFKGKEDLIAKVKLIRDSGNVPWYIKSRFLYRNFKSPRKEPRLDYYSYHKEINSEEILRD